MKPLNPIQLSSLADQVAQRWHVKIDPRVNPIEDLFRPQFWVNCAKLSNGDRIRVEAIDGSYDFELKVDAKTVAGKPAVRVSIFPNLPDYVRAAAASSTEMLPQTLNGKPVPRIDSTNAEGYRVIGFDGNVASFNHGSEAEANIAMGQYVAVYGIKTVADRPATDAKSGDVSTPRAAQVVKAAPVIVDPNLSPQKRKEAQQKADKEAQREADMKALAARKQSSEETAA